MTNVEPAIKAIPTRYAGCHFRSRLEARWAVFFDALGIEWEYEPQGFNCYWRLNLDDTTFPYLPDFWLPDEHLWVEVKGSLTDDELLRLLNAAAFLSAPGGGCGEGGDMLVCGPVPRPEPGSAQWMPTLLHMHKGDLEATRWPDAEGCHGTQGEWPGVVARDVGGDGDQVIREVGATIDGVRTMLLQGDTGIVPIRFGDRYAKALGAARSARFEHGHSGAS